MEDLFSWVVGAAALILVAVFWREVRQRRALTKRAKERREQLRRDSERIIKSASSQMRRSTDPAPRGLPRATTHRPPPPPRSSTAPASHGSESPSSLEPAWYSSPNYTSYDNEPGQSHSSTASSSHHSFSGGGGSFDGGGASGDWSSSSSDSSSSYSSSDSSSSSDSGSSGSSSD